jgi:uncharacterized membrane protein (DUF2068 family)
MRAAKRDPLLTLIGVGKVVKAVGLVGLGIVAFRLEYGGAAQTLRHWAFSIGLNPGSRIVSFALERAGLLDPRTLHTIGYVMFAYAVLFAVEATGLLLQKVWGEWVTIAITGSFIPLEVWETVRHPHIGRAVTIVVNVAVVAYLLWRVRTKDRAPRREPGREVASSSPPPSFDAARRSG